MLAEVEMHLGAALAIEFDRTSTEEIAGELRWLRG